MVTFGQQKPSVAFPRIPPFGSINGRDQLQSKQMGGYTVFQEGQVAALQNVTQQAHNSYSSATHPTRFVQIRTVSF